MFPCGNRDLLKQVFNAEVDEATSRAALEHLASCETCWQFYATLRESQLPTLVWKRRNVDHPTNALQGVEFGEYELLEEINRGAMGVVYKAWQRTLDRLVAIKVLRAGELAEPSDLVRFIDEARAAAAIQHPNIVAIYDSGERDGQLYFAMAYVEGQSLAQMVRENVFKPHDAATCVKTIAETMQAAHDGGVIHRDLKPSNVLVDKKGRPLIADFGLAKHVANQSQLTATGVIMGTPSYMSPEQARGDNGAVGVHSDVYAIGAILYELVTGRPPFRAASAMETVRQVIDNEPPAPRSLSTSVPKDLETIILKCLQKEPSKRYATSQGLADDLDRFLLGKPIQARPTGRVERLWKICKRYPIATAASALALLCLAGTATASTAAYLVTSRALSSETQAKTAETRAKTVAENRLTETRDVLQYLSDVSANKLANSRHLATVRKEMLEKVLDYHQQFARENHDQPGARHVLSKTYFEIAYLSSSLGRPVEAEEAYAQAIECTRRLIRDEPDTSVYRVSLATALGNCANVRVSLRNPDGAREMLREAIDQWDLLARAWPGDVNFERGRIVHRSVLALLDSKSAKNYEAAIKQFRDVETRYERFLEQFPADRVGQASFATHLLNQGQFETDQDQAQRSFEKALAQALPRMNEDAEGRLTVANIESVLGSLYRRQGKPAEARKKFESAIAVEQKLVQEDPDDAELRLSLARSHHNFAFFLTRLPELASATAQYQEAIAHKLLLCRLQPNNVSFRSSLAYSRYNLALLLKETSQETFVRELGDVVALLADDVSADQLHDPDDRARFVHAAVLVGSYYRDQGDQAKAAAWLRKALPTPRLDELHELLVLELGHCLLTAGLADEARPRLQTASQRLAKQDSADALYNAACAVALLATMAGQDDERSQLATTAVAHLERAITKGFKDVAQLDADPDFDGLRKVEAFQELRRRIGGSWNK
jgi:tetratricopeptide (TPR) repeat protein/tRNA A-37 threonylcarbamoyl transferase component Bud32